MSFRGATLDIPVRDLDRARAFYQWWHGRPPDLTPNPGVLEWVLHTEPQIAFRVVLKPDSAGGAHVGIGVDDLERERARLEQSGGRVPDIAWIAGVIALLELKDNDGNEVVYWQDLLPPR